MPPYHSTVKEYVCFFVSRVNCSSNNFPFNLGGIDKRITCLILNHGAICKITSLLGIIPWHHCESTCPWIQSRPVFTGFLLFPFRDPAQSLKTNSSSILRKAEVFGRRSQCAPSQMRVVSRVGASVSGHFLEWQTTGIFLEYNLKYENYKN